MYFFTSKQEKLEVTKTPLGRGGEGNVYEIINPASYRGHVVKIYHPRERTKERELKLIYMLSHRSQLETELSVMWPEEIIYQKQKFVGFLMPKAKSAIDLTSLCSSKLPKRLGQAWKQRYDRGHYQGLQNRLKVCQNIAKAFQQMHQTQQYVFVDIKPENIKVTLDGQVSVIDVDSSEVVRNQKLIFSGEKTSPEYSPAELKSLNIKKDLIDESWDRFSLAVVFYKVLFGLHPFTGTCKKPYDKLISNEQKIYHGLFPLGVKERYFQVIPEPHQAFHAIATPIQELFLRCFDAGHQNPQVRPSAQEWWMAFREKIHFAPIAYNQQASPSPLLYRHEPSKTPNKSLVKSFVGSVALVSVAMLGALHFSSYKLPDKTVTLVNAEAPKTISHQELSSEYGYVEHFSEGLAKIQKNDRVGFANQYGGVEIPFKYDWADNFQEGAARASINNKYGHVDKHGREIVPLTYDWVGSFHEGLAKVVAKGKTGYVNKENQLIVPLFYDYGGDFSQGFARVKQGQQWGYINQQGREVIRPQFQNNLNFSEGLAGVKRNGRWGFIDTRGRMVIPYRYQWVTSFVDGTAKVMIKGKEFYINAQGLEMLSHER